MARTARRQLKRQHLLFGEYNYVELNNHKQINDYKNEKDTKLEKVKARRPKGNYIIAYVN